MERLTKWVGESEYRQAIPRSDIRFNNHNRCCNKLAEYEDAEEQGTLIRSPYKPGDDIYCIERGKEKYDIDGIGVYKYMASVKGYIIAYAPYFGNNNNVDADLAKMCEDSQQWYDINAMLFKKLNVFPTRKEAKKKLEELKK